MTDRDSVRKRFRVGGIVQGVGFRPFVYALAARHELAGFVLNDPAGVLIEVEGSPEAVHRFRADLTGELPPLAVVDGVAEEELDPEGDDSFVIRESAQSGPRIASVSPDVGMCDECVAEMNDPRGRRYRYPFTNCTNCGPRFTITTGVPYDRPNTTMASFIMCEECAAEYSSAADRRFHAQPIACPACGPQVELLDGDGRSVDGDPIPGAIRMLKDGRILAVKGLGGYHLACVATDDAAVTRLRQLKAREEKPFALMTGSIESAALLVELSSAERSLLESPRRPIVLARRRSNSAIAPSVAPGNAYLGVMLPYTPLHHLLLEGVDAPVVLTSGNLSDEPIAYRDDDARKRLAGVADAFLSHDREIHIRCDDSVMRMAESGPYPIRRSRGYAPEPLRVEVEFARPVLAAGPELKHTFCLGSGRRAILSHHIGDLESYEAMSAFTEGVEHYARVFDIHPEVVAHDLHPEYLATKWALHQPDVECVGVQHHHAHIASCLADNGREGRALGLALDGTGFGTDGAIWGCEVLACNDASFERLLHLRYVPLPGGAAAIREPWRMAAIYLEAAFGDRAQAMQLNFVRTSVARWRPITQMASTGLNSPLTSSAGRLFDAVAAVCGLRERVSYEGQAAAELEQIADPSVRDGYDCTVDNGIIDGVELVAGVGQDLERGSPVPLVAARFHNGLAAALVAAAERAREETALNTVALSGGTFQNVRLLEGVTGALGAAGFEVLTHRRVPCNDGGISLGQAIVANAHAASSRNRVG